jgi:hypothetical protein
MERRKDNSPKVGKRLYTIPESAAYLGRTEWAVRHLLLNGILPVVRIDRRAQVDVIDLDLLIDRSKAQSGRELVTL